MTFEEFEKADKLIKNGAAILEEIQDLRERFKNDSDFNAELTEFYFKLKQQIDQKLKDI